MNTTGLEYCHLNGNTGNHIKSNPNKISGDNSTNLNKENTSLAQSKDGQASKEDQTSKEKKGKSNMFGINELSQS